MIRDAKIKRAISFEDIPVRKKGETPKLLTLQCLLVLI
jgi:hypothetical protein